MGARALSDVPPLAISESLKPTLNPLYPLYGQVVRATSSALSGASSDFKNRPVATGPSILRLLPQAGEQHRLASNSPAANRLEIDQRLSALRGTFHRAGLDTRQSASANLARLSANQLFWQLQQLQSKNRELMRMAPPDSLRESALAEKIESEYDKNKFAALELQREILLRLKAENGQLTPMMIAVLDNLAPEKFSVNSNRVRFPPIPPEWRLSDQTTREFEEIKSRANNLIDQLNFSKFADPDFCAKRGAELDFIRRLSRSSTDQMKSSADAGALRRTLMQSVEDSRKSQELGRLFSALNPKRNLADAEAFAHFKTMGFFAAKILKQLENPRAQSSGSSLSSPSRSSFSSASGSAAAGHRAFSQRKELTSAPPSRPFRANRNTSSSAAGRTERAMEGKLSAPPHQTPASGQKERLVERVEFTQVGQIDQLRSALQMDRFRATDLSSMERAYQSRFDQIEKQGDISAASAELQASKKERQGLQTLLQSMRAAGQTPGELELRAFRFFYYKSQAAEGLNSQVESRNSR